MATIGTLSKSLLLENERDKILLKKIVELTAFLNFQDAMASHRYWAAGFRKILENIDQVGDC